MASTIARRIVTEISAKNKAKGEMAAFRRDLRSTATAMKRMAAGALAVAGVAGIGYMIKQEMAAIDATAKLSDRLNASTEELVALQHQAEITGTNQSTLNKSLEVMTKRMGEVRMGVGQARYALDEMGLSADELVKKSPSEALGIIADRMNKMETSADKAAAANYLFGRSGTTLMNMLSEGSEGIAKYREEAERLGITFSRFEAGQVEAANDAMTRLQSTLVGASRVLVIQLAPYVETLADDFTNAATSGEGLGATLTSTFEQVAISIARVGEEIEWIIRRADHWKNKVTNFLITDKLSGQISETKKEIKLNSRWAENSWTKSGREKYANRVVKYRERLAILEQQLADEKARNVLVDPRGQSESVIKAKFDQIRADTAARKDEYQRNLPKRESGGSVSDFVGDSNLASKIDTTTAAMEMVNDGRAANARSAEFQLSAEEAFGKGTEKYTAAVERYNTALEKINETRASGRMEDITAQLDRQIETTGRLGRAWENSAQYAEYHKLAAERFGEGTAEYEAAMDSLDEKFKKLEWAERFAEAADTMAEGMSEAIGDMLFEGKSLEEGMRRVFQSIAQEAVTQSIKIMMIKMAASVIGSEKGNVFQHGRVQRFDRGGVVYQESAFGMSDGNIGTMAEGNKPEAIMPLARDNNGRLGVAAQGGGTSVENNLKILNMIDDGFVANGMRGRAGEKVIFNHIRANVGAIKALLNN